MSDFTAIEKSKYIDNKYKEYLLSSFEFESDELQELFIKELENENLLKGPFLDLNLPFKRGKNINQLIDENVLCKTFKSLSKLDFERPLYVHQEESIKKIKNGKSIVITTGTGSGKTECFLYPIINTLLAESENGGIKPGVRAIFLYPMNALINDQIERVRNILKSCPQITYGFYTGDTPEKMSKEERRKFEEKNDYNIPKNEILTREEIRQNAPSLLFTNYSMLEYLLIRPKDSSLVSTKCLKNFKFVVLDEAHTYNGAKGMEIALLLRRVTGFAEKKPQFILTSATLGEKNKSEDKIIEFAQRLTSADYKYSDIIFSERIPLDASKIQYTVKGADYLALKNHLDNYSVLKTIVNNYVSSSANTEKELLYDLLESDSNVYKLYDYLKSGAKDISELNKNRILSLTSEELSSLIDLLNRTEKNGIGLFELKYHSFIRPLSGAYITLEEHSKLRLSKTNYIDEMKAFEVGCCRYCNTAYIMGRIKKDPTTNLDYLYQNDEIDIYENYGDNEYIGISYFLLKNNIDEEAQDEKIIEYKICAKCGAIFLADNLNSQHCECGEKYLRSIYRVVSKEGKDSNNIRQCVCCGHRRKDGIVKNLNLGKDEGTAIISQLLLETMETDTVVQSPIHRENRLSLRRKGEEKKEVIKPRKIKQFIAFSDSRQQASFFATFLTANHTRFLRKRIIWEELKNNDYKDISVNELAVKLTNRIQSLNLFKDVHEDLNAQKNAWISILIDLLKVDGRYDSEGVGLYYFDLNLSIIENDISEDEIKEFFEGKLSKEDFFNLLQIIFNVFKITPAIDYSKSTLTQEEKKEYLEYRRFDNYIILSSDSRKDSNIKSFLPKKGSNQVTRYVQKILECDNREAMEILDSLFDLGIHSELFKQKNNDSLYQIDTDKYIVRNYKRHKFYQCDKCKRITPYNIHNKCPYDKCDGILKEIDPDMALKNNYYRKQYKSKTIENIVVAEHTAQLEKEKAKQYQKDFKNQKINILSCSTTFEMGVDIGDLETVFMRNIPPTPANYVQRAGRAGRRKDSSAYILTYCGLGSHDYTYFNNPIKMISGKVNPPYFSITNEKIVNRHILGSALGFFFKEYPDLFKNVDAFVFNKGISIFDQYLSEKPLDLKYYIEKKVLPESIFNNYHNFGWIEEIKSDNRLMYLEKSLKNIVNEYNVAKKNADTEGKVKFFESQICEIKNTGVIKALAKYCVIPKYGFPVDVVNLDVYENGRLNTNINLNRDLKIAISEYAPDSEVIANKRKYTSKYISQPYSGELTKQYIYVCPKCNKTNIFLTYDNQSKCKYCDEEFNKDKLKIFIEPTEGFKTGETKESTRMKPKRSYAGEVAYLGGGEEEVRKIQFGNIEMISTKNDELLVMNKKEFYMCNICGYSEIINSDIRPSKVKVSHKNYRQFTCKNDELIKISIGHRFRTDVVRIVIPRLLAISDNYAKALSLLYALLEGISNALDIERNDIDGVVDMNLDYHTFDLIIYDKVPGGAGHVKRVLNANSFLLALSEAYKKVNQNCCDEDTSCYNCLRNYYNQSFHTKLKRKDAKEWIEILIRECE